MLHEIRPRKNFTYTTIIHLFQYNISSSYVLYESVGKTGLTNSFQKSGTIQTCDRQPRKENTH